MTEPPAALGKRILLAEDEPTVRESIKLLLHLDRHLVTEASNGREALKIFEPDKFDLVITDYLMPEMHGDELARNIKQIAPSRPVLIVTAWAEKLFDSGKPADIVLGKPVVLEELRKAIAQPANPTSTAGSTGKSAAPGSQSSSAKPGADLPAPRRVPPTVPGVESDTSFLRGWGIND